MQFKTTSSNVVSDNLLIAISNNTGVNNYSSSSKIKNISDAFADEISNLAQSADNLITKVYTTTATADALDSNGYQYDTYRKNNNSVIIQSTDQLIQVESISGAFNPLIFDTVLLDANTRIGLGNNVTITLLEDLVITSLDIVKYLSVKLEATSFNSSLQLSSGDSFRLNIAQNPNASDLVLTINTNITTYNVRENDTDYRERIITAKTSPYASVEQAITNALLGIDGVLSVGYNRLFFGAANIGILTREMFLLGIETSQDLLLNIANGKIYHTAPAGYIYDVFIPEPIHLKLDVKLVNAGYDLTFVKSTIIKVFQSKYRYNDQNLVLLSALNREVHKYIPPQDIRIYNAQLYLPTIDGTILTSEEELNIPLYGFGYLIDENINIEIVANV